MCVSEHHYYIDFAVHRILPTNDYNDMGNCPNRTCGYENVTETPNCVKCGTCLFCANRGQYPYCTNCGVCRPASNSELADQESLDPTIAAISVNAARMSGT